MPKRDPDLDAVKARIAAVKSRHKVRWTVSAHTAEMAIAAFAAPERREPRRPDAKSRRRKRNKRLL